MIVFVGGELFTGDCMMSMAWMQRKIHFADMLRTLVLVYVRQFRRCGSDRVSGGSLRPV